MLEEMVDAIKDPLGVLVSDPVRFAMVFIFSAIVLGVIIGSAYAPTLGGALVGTTITASCTNQTAPLIVPLVSYLENVGNGANIIQCAISNASFVALALWYVELLAIILVAVLVAISLLNLS